jgi:hypothetical protein
MRQVSALLAFSEDRLEVTASLTDFRFYFYNGFIRSGASPLGESVAEKVRLPCRFRWN